MYNSIIELIGNTPILKLNKLKKELNLIGDLFVKLEMFNISGSIKDRIAKNIILEAISEGLVNKDTLIVEATSGNFGISLAAICASLDLNLLCIMPDSVSIERQEIIKLYGGNIILTPKELGMKGSLEVVEKIKNENNNIFIPSQFTNIINSFTHFDITGPEIYQQMDGKVDILISGIGSGGSITGIAKLLKSKRNVHVIGVEPEESPLLSKGKCGIHNIEGIGPNFIPDILEVEYIDDIKTISYKKAVDGVNLLAKNEGVFVGISAGAALMIGIEQALLQENKNKQILVILPDTGNRYLSKLMIGNE